MSEASFKVRCLCSVGTALIRMFGATWRLSWDGVEHDDRLIAQGRPIVFAFRHGHLLAGGYAFRDYGIGVMASRHRDGELGQGIGMRLGYVTYRGSTTRGGTRALLEMCRVPLEVPLGLTIDGPKGPAGTVHPGIVLLAQRTQRAIVPLGFAARPAWRLRSWDGHLIPWPFARLHIVLGEPIFVPPEADSGARPAWIERIQASLAEADERARTALECRGGPRGSRGNRGGYRARRRVS